MYETPSLFGGRTTTTVKIVATSQGQNEVVKLSVVQVLRASLGERSDLLLSLGLPLQRPFFLLHLRKQTKWKRVSKRVSE